MDDNGDKERHAAIDHFLKFLIRKQGSALKAWIKHFDANNDHVVTKHEFSRGMAALGYKTNAHELFDLLDSDGSGDLTIADFDGETSVLWRRFREWCAGRFEGAPDMIERLASAANAKTEEPSFRAALTQVLTRNNFKEGLQALGWTSGAEDALFEAIENTDGEPGVSVRDLSWLELELQRLRKKHQAKARFKKDTAKRVQNQQESLQVAKGFKRFLKKKFGGYVHAWRRGLSSNDSLVLQKAQFLIGCQNVGWKENLNLLFNAFDKDGSGEATVEELDLRETEILARFSMFIKEKFGNSKEAFRALDKDGVRSIRHETFAEQLKKHGLHVPTKQLFHGLDKTGSKVLNEEDLQFLDTWKPLPYLAKAPSKKAAEELKACLALRYKNLMKAWLCVLDVDYSNVCNWYEFKAGCEKARYTGDIAGAWRALDQDLSGFITLQEIDEKAHAALVSFRRWADEEFGGVRSALTVFDTDGSDGVSFREFLRACRIYNFPGDTPLVKQIYSALDNRGNKCLSAADVSFLDQWILEDVVAPAGNNQGVESGEDAKALSTTTPRLTRRLERLARPKGDLSSSPSPCSDQQDLSPRLSIDPLHMYREVPANIRPKQAVASNVSPRDARSSPVDVQKSPELCAVAKRAYIALANERQVRGFASSLPKICDQIFLCSIDDGDCKIALDILDVGLRERLRAELSFDDVRLLWTCLVPDSRAEVDVRRFLSLMYEINMSDWPELSQDELNSLVLKLDLAAQKSYGGKVNWSYLVGMVDARGNTQVTYDLFCEFVQRLMQWQNSDAVSVRELQGLWKAVDKDCDMEVPGHKFKQFMQRRGAWPRVRKTGEVEKTTANNPQRDVVAEIAAAPRLSEGALGNLAARMVSLLRYWIGQRGLKDPGMVIWPQSLSTLFDTVDIDGCGSVSYLDLEVVLKSASQDTGNALYEEGVRSMWRVLDKRSAGCVKAADFCAKLYTWQLLTWPKIERGDLERVVSLLNRKANKYHRTSGKGWYKVLVKCNVEAGGIDFNFMYGMVRGLFPSLSIGAKELSDSDLQGLWRALDAEQSGLVSIDTFLRFIKTHSKVQPNSGQSFPALSMQQVGPAEQAFTKLWKALDRL